MTTIRVIFFCFSISIAAFAQATATEAAQIPAGVNYKAAPDAVNASAKKALALALSPGSEVSKDFFDTSVICGPTLWRALKPSADKVLLESKLVVGVANSVQTELRGLITDEQRQSFWLALLKKYPALKTANIRKANAEEIRYYWATIFFDIEEPFFTIDTGSERFVAHFQMHNGKPALFWIDLVGDINKLSAQTDKVTDMEALIATAEYGDVNAMVQLGKAYWKGSGVPADIEKGRIWLDRASVKGSLDAQMLLGAAYFSGTKLPKDTVAAAKYLQLGAKQGNAMAQYYVGMMHRHGEGLDKSDEKAAQYLQLAAAQNFTPAEYDLGLMYCNGEGVPVDKRHGCTLYAKAAEQGHVAAMNNLGQCYEHGEGVEKDLGKALELYTKSANAGDVQAQGNLANLSATLGNWENSYIWARIAE
ncbi:MAG: tetratricopeptide repeat protein, partial [Bryobacteraceae bacterium]